MNYPFKRIIRDMVRLYQMWLFIRMVECIFTGKVKSKQPFTMAGLGAEFCKKKTWLGRGRSYNADEAMRAYGLAKAKGYLTDQLMTDKHYHSSVNDIGYFMTSPTYLINELSKSIASIGTLTAVIISAVALYLSIRK